MKSFYNNVVLIFAVSLLVFFSGCKTTESSRMNGDTDSLYINSQFKTHWNDHPAYGPYSDKEMKLINEKGAEYVLKSRTPFEYNLIKVFEEVCESKGITTEGTAALSLPFCFLIYTDREIRETALDATQTRLMGGKNTLYKLTQSIGFYAFTEDSDDSELVGKIRINFNTFNQNSLVNTEIYREIYDRALNFIGKNTTDQVGFKYIDGVGISEPTRH